MISKIIHYGKKHHVPVEICGEMGSHADWIELLFAIGITHFSVSTNLIPFVSQILRNTTLKKSKKRFSTFFKIKKEVVGAGRSLLTF